MNSQTWQRWNHLNDGQLRFVQDTLGAYQEQRGNVAQIAEKQQELDRVDAEIAAIDRDMEQIRLLLNA